MFGNYANYYGYRNDRVIDSRLSRLPKHLFDSKDILDVGCNSGQLTLDIALLYPIKSITALDIDPSLVRKAKQNLYASKSLVKNDNNTLYYYPLSCMKEHSTLNYSHSASNIHFRCSDFIQEPLNPNLKYDLILAMSITKWIHLEYSDPGIKLFFSKCYSALKAGGILVLEPQSWDTYKKKIKLDKRLQENYLTLKIMPEEFGGILEGLGFKEIHCEIGKEVNAFKRPIFLFEKGKL